MTTFDRRIDAAAKDIVAKEPSRNLRYNVMARIHRANQSTRRRFSLVLVSSAATACIIAAIVLNTPPRQENMTFVQARSFPQQLSTAPTVNVSPPAISALHVTGKDATARRAPAERVQAMQLEPIRVDAIEVGPIEPLATSVTMIDLTDLTIEPLAASNY